MRTSQAWIFAMKRTFWRPAPMLDTSTCGNTAALIGMYVSRHKFYLNSSTVFENHRKKVSFNIASE